MTPPKSIGKDEPRGLNVRARPYSRELIPGDHPVAPFELKGFKRTAFALAYGTIVVSGVCGLAYTFYFNPAFAAAALALGYLFENLAFTFWHVEFHTEFIELPESAMPTLTHHAFIHHYRNIGVFHERCLETRLSYFLDPRSAPTLGRAAKLLAIVLLLAALAYFVSLALAIAWYSAQVVPALIQSVVHEWYHNPAKNRTSFYSPPVYAFFSLLEKTGLASTREHLVHHRQGLDNLNQVDKWLDLACPFGEVLPTRLWREALARYVPGEARMNGFMRRRGPVKILIGDRLLAGLTIIAAYFLIVR